MPYINENKFYTYGLKTFDELALITGLDGETVYNTTNHTILTWNNGAWSHSNLIRLINNSGGAMFEGDVVSIDPGGSESTPSCILSAEDRDILVMGPVVFGGSDGELVSVAIGGNWKVAFDASMLVSHWVAATTTAGRAGDMASSSNPFTGVFAISMETVNDGAGSLAECIILPRKEMT